MRFEAAVSVRGVTYAAEAATDDLLAEQLRAKRSDAEDMGNSISVPTFSQHRDGDDALDLLAQLALLADGIHHLPKKIFISKLLNISAGEARPVFRFVGMHLTQPPTTCRIFLYEGRLPPHGVGAGTTVLRRPGLPGVSVRTDCPKCI